MITYLLLWYLDNYILSLPSFSSISHFLWLLILFIIYPFCHLLWVPSWSLFLSFSSFLFFSYFCTFCLSFSFLPNLPPPLYFSQFLIKKLGVDTVTYGYLESMSAVGPIFLGPWFGRFADKFGAKIYMTLCLMGCFFFFSFLAIATNVIYLVFSRMAAVFIHVFHCTFF